MLRDPGASGSPCSSPEPLFPRRAQNLRTGPSPWSFLTVHRGLSQSNPRREDTAELECEYNISGPIIKCKKPNGEKSEFSQQCFLFSSSCPSRENYCLIFAFFPPSHMHFWAFFFNSWKKNTPPHKRVFKKKQK